MSKSFIHSLRRGRPVLLFVLVLCTAGIGSATGQTASSMPANSKSSSELTRSSFRSNDDHSKPNSQPTPAATPTKSGADPAIEERLKVLEDQLKAQGDKLVEMSKTIDEQQRTIQKLSTPETQAVAQPGNAMPLPSGAAGIDGAGPVPQPVEGVAIAKPQSKDKPEEGPLSIRIGNASITPVGFLDFTAMFRSTTGGSGIGTNFGSIPFGGSTIQGNLSELRFSAQNSRIGFRVDTNFHGASVIGYFESDFLGNNPGNVSVSSNSDTNRLRLYWVDVKKDKLELLGGQSWSMLTPGRKGISPIPGDIFYTQLVDVNYQAGLVWSRQPQFRIVYHANPKIALGLSLEEPEQYIGGSGGAGVITFPTALATPYGAQLDSGASTLSVPNQLPDIIGKFALDEKIGDHDIHFEAAALVRKFRVFNPANLEHFSKTGGGGSLNVNFAITKNVRIVSNNFFSDGGGRYIFGQAPDLIVRGDGTLSSLKSGSTVSGIEATAGKNFALYGYYGGIYIMRNSTIDPANGKLVGYGYGGSPNSQNRSIQEATFGFTDTFWKDPKYGALQLMGQYSYLVRRPWFVPVGGFTQAHTNMVYFNLRYLLPGKPPS